MSTPPYGPQPPHGPGQPPYGQGQPPYGPGQPPYGPGQPPYGPPAYGPPAYGPPPWTPPEPPRRDRRRRLLVVALVAVVVALAAGSGLLVYVLSSTRLDPAAVERDVALQFEQQYGEAVELECDRIMVVRPGADHGCEGTTAGGDEVELLIEVTSEDGAYTWDVDD